MILLPLLLLSSGYMTFETLLAAVCTADLMDACGVHWPLLLLSRSFDEVANVEDEDDDVVGNDDDVETDAIAFNAVVGAVLLALGG